MIRKIVLVFKTHFDIGFTDLSENVIRNYGNGMLRQVIETCRATENMGKLRYVWTMPSWPLRHIIDHCEPELKGELERLIRSGQITWHALPFTSHTDCCAPEEYAAALLYAKELSERYNKPCPVAGKMTDVPGHGLMLPELLSQAGIRFLHLGCNEFATPPDVPRLFFWQSQQGGRVLTMYSKGGYGTSLLPPEDWPFPVWMALMHTQDNCGPQTAAIITGLVEKAKKVYPGAEIVCGTMDDFYRELAQCDLSEIPVITEDLADTWIHGVGSYPKEVSQLRENRLTARELHKRYTQHFLENNKLISEWDSLWNRYYEQTALFEEHTWGADVKTWLGPDRVYEKDEFLKARSTEPYRFMERSWAEQSSRMQNASATLQEISALLPESESKPKPLSLLTCKNQGNLVTVCSDRYEMVFDKTNGMIKSLTGRASRDVILQSRGNHGIFSYQYDRAGIEDVTEFLRSYGYRFTDWGILDYGRSKYPECPHLSFSPYFEGYEAQKNAIRFHYHTSESSEKFGDCHMLTLTITFSLDGTIEAELTLKGKQASPFIEAGSFIIPLPEKNRYLLGRPCAEVDPETQIRHCANHSLYCLEDRVTAIGAHTHSRLTVFPQDTPLLSIGSSGLYDYEPDFPKEREPELWFNLFNNMWGTNFPQWIEGDFRYRFTVCPEGAVYQPETAKVSGIPDSLEVVQALPEDGKLFVLLRDHGKNERMETLHLPGFDLFEADLLHRQTGPEAHDELTFTVRPNGLHCIAISKRENKDQ